jgi:hypothetical protein
VTTSKQLVAGFALVAALALPSSAMARHGADDPPAADDNGQATQAPGADDQQHTEPGDAQDDRGGPGGSSRSDAAPRTEDYNLRGSVVSIDPSTDTAVVQIKKANHGRRGRALLGQQVTVDLTNARLQVADANGDGVRDIDDVSARDRVEVRLRLPKSQSPDLSQPVAASRFKDRSAAHADEAAGHS